MSSGSGGVPDVLREATAAAVLGVMEQHRPCRIRRGIVGGDYEQCQAGCKYEPGGSWEHMAPLLADAAISALQLTEQQGVRFKVTRLADDDSECEDYGPNCEPILRFVGPWRAAE